MKLIPLATCCCALFLSLLLLLAGFTDAAFQYKSFSKYEKGPSLCTCYGPCPDGHCPASNCTGASKYVSKGRHGCGNVSTTGERELALFTPPASGDNSPISKITMMWFTTDVVSPGWPNTTINVYIDGETEPSISFRMYEAMAMPSDKRAAFGDVQMFQSKHTGKGGIWGGLSFFRDIPFQSSARITAKASELDFEIGVPFSLYYRVAGIYGAPARIGDLELPTTARLGLTRVSKFYQPLEHIYAYQSPANTSGIFAGLVYLAKSHSAHFLEGIWETSSNGETFQDQGAGEDLLLSENYADAGWFGHQLNGVPHRSLACITDDLPNLTETCSFSGYRWYDSDPIIFEESLVFRGQVGDPATHNKRLFQTHYTTLAWVYTWPKDEGN